MEGGLQQSCTFVRESKVEGQFGGEEVTLRLWLELCPGSEQGFESAGIDRSDVCCL